jgi:hypothetical protein
MATAKWHEAKAHGENVHNSKCFPPSSPSISVLGQYPSSSCRSARIKPVLRERPSDHSGNICNQPSVDRACWWILDLPQVNQPSINRGLCNESQLDLTNSFSHKMYARTSRINLRSIEACRGISKTLRVATDRMLLTIFINADNVSWC